MMKMNVLSTTVGTEVVPRRLVDPNTEDKDDYSLFGLFLGDDDELDLDKLICRGTIAEVPEFVLFSSMLAVMFKSRF